MPDLIKTIPSATFIESAREEAALLSPETEKALLGQLEESGVVTGSVQTGYILGLMTAAIIANFGGRL